MTDFWTEHVRREEHLAYLKAGEDELRRIEARLPQNAPAGCAHCGHHGMDVLFGICAGCHGGWYPED